MYCCWRFYILNKYYCCTPWTVAASSFVQLSSESGVTTHFASVKPWGLRTGLLLLWFCCLFFFFNTLSVLAHFGHRDWENIWFLYNFTFWLFFSLFFSAWFCLKKPHYLHQILDGKSVPCRWHAHLCANSTDTMVSGTFFSRRWLWGGLKCDTVVKLTFSKTFFTFFTSFLNLVFWAPFGQ